MSLAQFTNQTKLPNFNLETKLEEVQSFLLEHNWSHLPLRNNQNKWIGNLLSQHILEADSLLSLEDLLYDLEPFYITEEYNPLQYFDIFAKYESTIIPCLDEQNYIIAIILKELVLEQSATIDFLSTIGVTVVVETNLSNFSFAQICQLIEGNNAKLLGIIQLNSTLNTVQILFRTNGVNTKSILNDLRRFDYAILSKHIEDTHQVDLEEKSAYLTKYLNI